MGRSSGGKWPPQRRRLAAHKKIEAEKKLAEVVEALKASGLRVSYVYRESFASASQEIISYAENNGCDMIAMATHGKGEVPGYSEAWPKK